MFHNKIKIIFNFENVNKKIGNVRTYCKIKKKEKSELYNRIKI